MSFFRFKFIALVLAFAPIACIQSQESDEALAIRRIATCIQEKDFSFSKKLIELFLNEYPNSDFEENLYQLLADVYLQEKDFEKALALYQLIQKESLAKESFSHLLHCHYSLKNFSAIKKLLENPQLNFSTFSKDDQKTLHFYYAEALSKDLKNNKNDQLLNKIISEYKLLLNSSYEKYAVLNLGYLYTEQKNHKLASKYFVKASKHFPKQKEDLLFLAAQNQTHFDLKGSLNTFYEIKSLEESKAYDALYNSIVLLFYSQSYDQIIASENEIIHKVPLSKKALTYLILGKSYFNKSEYEKALSVLQRALTIKKLSAEEEKEILFISSLCSYNLSDQEKFNTFFSPLERKFRNEKEHFKALFLKAKLLQKDEAFKRAQNHFIRVSKCPFTELSKAAYFESSLCFFMQNQFQKSHDSFLKFLQAFEENQYTKPALYYLLQSTSKLYQKKATDKVKIQLISDYNLALDSSFFDEEEKEDVQLKIARLYFDLHNNEKLFPFLNSIINQYPDKPLTYQAHLLFALAYKKDGNDYEYINHLEKASKLPLTKEEICPIYLHLFQAYFDQAKQEDEKSVFFDKAFSKACDYLYEVIKLDYSIPKPHFLWLAESYFYHLRKVPTEEKDSLLEKSIEVMSLFLEKYPKAGSLPESQLRFHYAQVLGMQNKTIEKVHFLKSFISQLEPSHFLYIQSMLELGKSYEILNEKKLAIDTYEKIISGHNHSIPTVTFTAKLRLARLLTESYLKNPQEETLKIISKYYQDLYHSRSLKSEPIHLEAALDYALLQNVEKISQANYKSYLETLYKLKKDFSEQDTISSKEYHEMRSLYPEKNKLYEAYMMFVDAKILHLQAKINLQNNSLKQADEKINLAKNLIERLQRDTQVITPYLKEVTASEWNSFDSEEISNDYITSHLRYKERL